MMRADIFYKKIIPLWGALLFGIICYAQETVSKQVEKSYGLTNNGELHIDNKYGDVVIYGWDRSSIKLTVDIEVSHKKRENAKELLERIAPNIKVTKDFVNITSEISEKSSGFFSKYFNKVNPFDLDKSNVKINYTIYLPSNAEMDIVNKFGDVIISDWEGKLKANVEHGDIWVSSSLTHAHITMKFGKVQTKDITYGDVTIKNGELDMGNSTQLRVNSSGTPMEMDTISSLEMYSSKDEIQIDKVENIQGNISFSKMRINSVGENIDLTTKVADIWIYGIEKPDSNIYIDQESSELNINISGQSIIFNASLEQGLLRIPRAFTDINTEIINKGRKIREINATYGQGPYGEFVLKGLKGVIVLKE